MKILYIEDNKNNLFLMQKILEDVFPEFYTAVNGKEGLELFYKYVPDILLVDLNLPDISGFEIIERLKVSKKLSNTTAIAISGYNDEETIKKVYGAGFDGFIEKPVEVNSLIEYLLKVHNFRLKSSGKNILSAKETVNESNSDRVKNFLEAISHELKTPITSLIIDIKNGKLNEDEILERLKEYVNVTINRTVDFFKNEYFFLTSLKDGFSTERLLNYLENNYDVNFTYLIDEKKIIQNFVLVKYLFDIIINFILSFKKDTIEIVWSNEGDYISSIFDVNMDDEKYKKLLSDNYLRIVLNTLNGQIGLMDNKLVVKIRYEEN